MEPFEKKDFAVLFTALCFEAYENSVSHGWWDGQRSKAESIALMHSELSETLEGIRTDNKSDHLPGFTAEEEELADVIIRIMDYALGYNLRLIDAIFAKMEYNKSRPFKHGKKF